MLIDTHCHINTIIKPTFDIPLTEQQLSEALTIIEEAYSNDVKDIINVGTSLIESQNCILLAQKYQRCYAAVGIHPNDCTAEWNQDFKQIKNLWFKNKEQHQKFKIVGIGECGLDRHYPGYHLQRQKDAFKAHIELALEHNLALIVHTRDAAQETLYVLEEYKKNNLKGVIHCFSEDQSFADTALEFGFVLGIGGPLTYPKNETLRKVFKTVPLEKIILETDAPFLPPQIIRGQKNQPKYIALIAQFLADLRGTEFKTIAEITTATAASIFNIKTH